MIFCGFPKFYFFLHHLLSRDAHIYSYLNLALDLCLGKVLIMGRGKHEHCWKHVTRVENENKWICKYCNDKFSGGASRIEAHLGLNGKGGGIRRCSNYPPVAGNEGVQNNNNMASTSSNPPPEVAINRVYSTQDKGK